MKSLVARSMVAGAAGLLALAMMPEPSFAVGDTPAPAPSPAPGARCAKLKQGSAAWKRCMGRKRLKDDDEVYRAGYWQAKAGQHATALATFRTAVNQADPRIQTMIGYTLRQLGHVDEAMGYYLAALDADPGRTTTRQYLGEAYVQKGERGKALEQLAMIGLLCGTTCEDYRSLARVIAAAG